MNFEGKSSQEIKEYFESIISLMPGHVYWKDVNGVILGCNDLQAKDAGLLKRQDIVGKTDYDMPWKEQASILRKIDVEIMQTGVPQTVEEPSTLADGTEAIFLSKKVPFYYKGEVVGIVGISFDITELKKTRDALAIQIKKTEQAHRSKAEFLSIASHEIRNPISNVIYVLQSILKEQLNILKDYFHGPIVDALNETKRENIVNDIIKSFDALFEYYRDTEKAAQNALSALKNLDDLHRLQLHGIKPVWDFTDVRSLLNKAIAKSSYPDDKNLELEIYVDPKLPNIVTLDYENITKALSVVIGNAFRFSKPYERVKVRVEPKQAHSNQLVISIQDFGAGMSSSQIDELLNADSFEVVEQESAPRYQKPSVQLLQAKMRIEASGGSLHIQSGINKGTTVTITAPYTVLEDEPKITVTSQQNTLANNLHDVIEVKLLLVEDDEGIRKITAASLRELGYSVDVAGTAMESLKLATEHNYDIVIMDLTLPDMNGLEVTRRLRKLYGDKMAFIGFTSYVSEEAIDNCYSAGMTMVLTKPVTKETFRKAIEEVLYAKTHEDDD